jgi:hypothetical protein
MPQRPPILSKNNVLFLCCGGFLLLFGLAWTLHDVFRPETFEEKKERERTIGISNLSQPRNTTVGRRGLPVVSPLKAAPESPFPKNLRP